MKVFLLLAAGVGSTIGGFVEKYGHGFDNETVELLRGISLEKAAFCCFWNWRKDNSGFI